MFARFASTAIKKASQAGHQLVGSIRVDILQKSLRNECDSKHVFFKGFTLRNTNQHTMILDYDAEGTVVLEVNDSDLRINTSELKPLYKMTIAPIIKPHQELPSIADHRYLEIQGLLIPFATHLHDMEISFAGVSKTDTDYSIINPEKFMEATEHAARVVTMAKVKTDPCTPM